MSDTIRIAGAQIPINDFSIEYNVNEIKKALDWAADNDVDIIQTPEASLSGYAPNHWLYRKTEEAQDDINLSDAIRDVEDYQKELGVGLNLGTCILSQEESGNLARNQIRCYSKHGHLYNVTDKLTVVGFDAPCVGSFRPGEVFDIDNMRCLGMLCNDMWSFSKKAGNNRVLIKSLMEIAQDESPDLIFHSTNGYKFPEETIKKAGKHLTSIRDNVYEPWHEGWLAMTAFSAICHILTVDTCVEWKWDGNENTVDKFKTSSQSGVLNPLGEWVAKAPRYGRHYFYYDLDVNAKHTYHNLVYHQDNGTLENMIPPATNSLMKQFGGQSTGAN